MSAKVSLKKYSFKISGDCNYWHILFSDSNKSEFQYITRSFVLKHPQLLELAQHIGDIQFPMKWERGQWYYGQRTKDDDTRVFFANRMLAAAFCAACHEYFNFLFITDFEGTPQIKTK